MESHACVTVRPLPGWREPLDVLPLFADSRMPALLLSGPAPRPGLDITHWSFLCADPFTVVTWSASQEEDPFRLLEETVSRYRCEPTDPPFAGGAVGFIGYEAGGAVEPIVPASGRSAQAGPAGHPDLLFGLYAWAIAWDHHRREWFILSTGHPESGERRRRKASFDVERVVARLAGSPASSPSRSRCDAAGAARDAVASVVGTSVPRERYLDMVVEARRLIAAGEVYQVNLSQRLELRAPEDPLAMFREVARASPAPFSAWLDAGSFQIVSASPERFCCLRGRAVEMRPIKGTRPRGATPAQDEALASELERSEKDHAENVMIVDLVRNDLGRVCAPGTIRAREICRIESYASVHHLTSIVTGELADGRDRADLLRAIFPGGSMTGAPKVRAMQAIEDLEPVPRGIYSGALGYLSFCGAMDLSIVIRTAVVSGGRAWLSVGGGVVADSDPEGEWRESLEKGASVLRGIAATSPGRD